MLLENKVLRVPKGAIKSEVLTGCRARGGGGQGADSARPGRPVLHAFQGGGEELKDVSRGAL